MLKIIRSNETSKIAVVTVSKKKKGDNLNNLRSKTSRISGIKRGNSLKTKLISL
jgi:hypothetical protein